MEHKELLKPRVGGLADLPSENAQLWRSNRLPEVTFFSACFRDFAYRPHTHEEYAIGVIEQGTERFRHKGTRYLAPPGTILTLNPDEVHDGQSETAAGYRYRMMYLNPVWVEEILAAGNSRIPGPRFFSTPRAQDPALAREIQRALWLWEQDQPAFLEAESRLVLALGALFSRHASQSARLPVPSDRPTITRVCEYLRVHATETLTLETLARQAGLSRYHFLRVFKATTGLSPHAYLIQMRVAFARRAIEQGQALAQAAVEAGFVDQSHLTQQFKSIYGVTPGQYQRRFHR